MISLGGYERLKAKYEKLNDNEDYSGFADTKEMVKDIKYLLHELDHFHNKTALGDLLQTQKKWTNHCLDILMALDKDGVAND